MNAQSPSAKLARRRIRRLGLALVSLVFLAVAFLTGTRVAETEIEMNLVTKYIKFRLLDEAIPVGPTLELRFLHLRDFAAIGLPDSRAGGQRSTLPLTLTAAAHDSNKEWIRLGAGLTASSTEVELEALSGGQRYRLRVTPAPAEPTLTVNGPLQVNGKTVAKPFDAEWVELDPGESMHLWFSLIRQSPSRPLMLFSQVNVDILGFSIDDRPELRSSGAILRSFDGQERTLSAIESGEIVLRDLNDEVRPLRRGDLLDFDQFLTGKARHIKLENGAVSLAFNGFGRELAIKLLERPRNLMPRRLSWLQAHEGAVLFWSWLTYLVGLGISIFSWCRDPE